MADRTRTTVLPRMSITDISIQHDLRVPMRDGVHLSTDLYLPPGGAPAPALLMRTPYNKRVAEFEAYAHPVWYARQGFAVAVQDVRGRFGSEGEFAPFHQEAHDGADAVEWIARQPWCSGKVGSYGFSYPGATQLLAAIQRPAGLAAMAPGMTASSYGEGWVYQRGALQLSFILSWAALLGREQALRASDLDAAAEFDSLLACPTCLFPRLPLGSAFSPELARHIPFLADWLVRSADEERWAELAPSRHYDAIQVPALHIAGWYDTFLEGTLENYCGIRDAGGAAQELIIGPWLHMPWSSHFAGGDHGPEARNIVDEAQVRFFRRTLMGEGGGGDPPVRIYVMGENRWHGFESWPPPGGHSLVLYLRSDGRANSLNGTGALSHEPPPADEDGDVWASDPSFPVVSLGGRSCCTADVAPMGPADQRDQESRNDVLVYSTDVLEHDVTVIGYPELTLFSAADTPSSDLVVRLVDVHPDGSAINVSDGNLRVRWTASEGARELPVPMSPTGIRFAAGHCIRLEVAGSSFPMYDRNSGSSVDSIDATAADFQVATQFVFHDASRPSRLVLPVR
jgi:putative CocE/NonD family hydrolase